MSITAGYIVKLFEEDARRLAELLVIEPDIRLALVNAIMRDVATRDDIDKLREGLRRELGELERRVNGRIK